MGTTAKILRAGAGSGKTFRLAYEYILEVLGDRTDGEVSYFDPYAYRHILAVTFTNKATEEMKSRILKQIDAIASGGRSPYLSKLMDATGRSEATLRQRAAKVRTAILHDYSRFTIITNDTFFQRILRAFVKEFSLERSYAIELEKDQVLSQSTDALIADINTEKELADWLSDMVRERVEKGEKWDIRRCIATLSSNLFEENTRYTIQNMGSKAQIKQEIDDYVKPIEALNNTIVARGKALYKSIVEQGYEDGFNSYAVSFIRNIANNTIKSANSTVSKIGASSDLFRKTDKHSPEKDRFAEVFFNELQWLIGAVDDISAANISRRVLQQNYRSFALMRDLYERAKLVCRDENKMILSETKHIISDLISSDDAPFIYEKVGTRFDKFMIDEFQDTSLKEWQNFLPLLRNAMAQSERVSTLLVGDIKQSIYRWRGGDWRILGELAPKELGNDEAPETLDGNYRSLEQIVKFNNMIFERIIPIENDHLNTMLDEASPKQLTRQMHSELYDTVSRAYYKHKQEIMRESEHKGYVCIEAYKGKVKEADGSTRIVTPDIIGLICHLIDKGYNPCDITIVVRANSEAITLAQQLLAQRDTLDERYHFDIMTQDALNINSSYTTRLILAIMRLSIDRRNNVARAIYNRYCNGGAFERQLTDEDHAFLDSIHTLSPEEAFERIVIRHAEALQPQTAYVEALHEQISKFSTSRIADIATWLKWWEDNGGKRSISVERSTRSLEILTIHKSKGLENKVIIIPRCDWQFTPKTDSGFTRNIIWMEPSKDSNIPSAPKFPVGFSSSLANSIFSNDYYAEVVYSYIENLNSLYVALTRAQEQLYIFINEDAPSNNVGQAICKALEKEPCKKGKDVRHYIFGEDEGPEPDRERSREESAEQLRLNDYTPSEVHIELRNPHSRYFEESAGVTPQEMGIMLHRAFEQATTKDDITTAIEQMQLDGTLSTEEAQRLTERIERTLAESEAGEWFDGSWSDVRCESNIIIPGEGSQRPDRVMCKGERCVVVDYKFGDETPRHREQILRYADLLQRMGYREVEGYVWYVTRGDIVRCK